MSETLRFVVDRSLCDGNGICAELAPDLVSMTEDDEPVILRESVELHERGAAIAAVRACPKGALSLED